MGKQISIIKFTGRVCNLIGYRRGGEYFFRSAPEKVRRTTATRRASRAFGIASGKAALIRRAIMPHLHMPQTAAVVNRLQRIVMRSRGGEPPQLEGFRFNTYTGLEKIFRQAPVFTADNVLRIPPQTLPAYGKATHLELSVIITRINFSTGKVEETDVAGETIDLSQPFKGLELGFTAPAQGMLLVTLQARAGILCNGRITYLSDRRYMAADIVAVLPAPEPAAKAKNKGSKHSSSRTFVSFSDMPYKPEQGRLPLVSRRE
ncbi:hypothetical protein [Chitinophaga barathri]|uniref:Uncharacterized protein n=1 Tax=Chitinophaga barathri TaxID=1647451 RepID=A0A3N4MEW6_9BACT|nr:hypothetical protein [Chitinophaga barathri]RPD42361.1 hypothetical protein EG028_04065 [Chitinophaga barathri]